MSHSIFGGPRFALTLSTSLLLSSFALAQDGSDRGKAMMVLDASGSMWGQINGEAKITIARDVIDGVLDAWDPNVDLGLIAYGHRRKGDCADIEVVQQVGPLDAGSFSALMRGVSPKGKTPISQSLFLAAKELRHVEEPASVILVSDGLETCDADPCIMAALLEDSGIDFTAHVVGFDLTEEEAEKLQCIADNTGGKFLNADNATELTEALAQTVVAVSEDVAAEPLQSEGVADDVPTKISELDLDSLSFDVITLGNDAATGKTVASGTSNGVGWTVVANSIYAPLTNQKGGARFNDLPGNYDDLHVGSDFTITFDRPVTSMLVVLGNDNDTGDGPNFQELAPIDFVDAANPDGGTQVRIDDPGGALFYYKDINITTMTHVNDNGIGDGWDLAFFVFPAAN
ncbi:Von Willebrand factor type A domain protein [Candidatus Rhodobacter oscarellae]|uniref:von Willebrand factor type A domain protein n=1 Tax=Candidatus Rhodobacter oscarellae TaxID=1675527 RepID=A0A0J9E5Q9_9RHOB|nr:VWA domain-containing protein [Candidatus Rhodobacter lobularis]KMW57114.1 Von Willebrand factor type A domain protein [Candidatus Rhodobacter lobularis]